MRKTARPVVWEGAGAQSPAPDPIEFRGRNRGSWGIVGALHEPPDKDPKIWGGQRFQSPSLSAPHLWVFSLWFMVPMRGLRSVVATHEPVPATCSRRPWGAVIRGAPSHPPAMRRLQVAGTGSGSRCGLRSVVVTHEPELGQKDLVRKMVWNIFLPRIFLPVPFPDSGAVGSLPAGAGWGEGERPPQSKQFASS